MLSNCTAYLTWNNSLNVHNNPLFFPVPDLRNSGLWLASIWSHLESSLRGKWWIHGEYFVSETKKIMVANMNMELVMCQARSSTPTCISSLVLSIACETGNIIILQWRKPRNREVMRFSQRYPSQSVLESAHEPRLRLFITVPSVSWSLAVLMSLTIIGTGLWRTMRGKFFTNF